jgi:hypothetical protein
VKFAPIIPEPWTIDVADLTEYHLILAHEVVSNAKYRDYYAGLGKRHTIILDNSTVELGYTDIRMVKEAFKSIREEFKGRLVCVCPDFISNSDQTIEETKRFLREFREPCELMIVPQGNTRREWIHCARELISICGRQRGLGDFRKTWLGIPRVSEDFVGGREYLFNLFDNQLAIVDMSVHLLGIQHNLQEVKWAKQNYKIKGCDSSLPYRAACAGMKASEVEDLREIPDVVNLFDETIRRTIENIDECVNCVNYV